MASIKVKKMKWIFNKIFKPVKPNLAKIFWSLTDLNKNLQFPTKCYKIKQTFTIGDDDIDEDFINFSWILKFFTFIIVNSFFSVSFWPVSNFRKFSLLIWREWWNIKKLISNLPVTSLDKIKFKIARAVYCSLLFPSVKTRMTERVSFWCVCPWWHYLTLCNV